MSLLVAHLTDVHITAENDPVLARAPLIARAIASDVEAATSVVVLAVGGDSAYSGKAEQFTKAREFYQAIRDKLLQERNTIQVVILAVAGNHDCDFSVVAANSTPVSENEKVPALSNFFHFAASVDKGCCPDWAASPFFVAHDVEVDGQVVRFQLINTSVSSSIHEKPGTLPFPVEIISPPLKPAAKYVITMVHHPWNWFKQPETMRPLRDKVESTCDIILAGHEHTPESCEFHRDSQVTARYVAGGILQDGDDPSESTFIVLHLDVDTKSQSTTIFKLNPRGFYERVQGMDAQSFPGNPARIGKSPPLRATFRHYLDDLGFAIHHPRKQQLTLPDIFVCPDLLIVDEPTTTSTKQLKSREVASTLLREHKVLVSGGDKSGKTCFSKWLFGIAHQAGRTPVYLKGGALQARTSKSLKEVIRRAVREQYEDFAGEQFEQLDRNDRIIIIDDFNRMVQTPEVRSAVLRELESSFGCVVLVGSDTFCFDALSPDRRKESPFWAYTHYNILSFGEGLREHFIRKWLTLAPDETQNVDLGAAVLGVTKIINGVIRNSLIPCYPLFLLIVLQQAESGQPTVRGGSYGHLFEAVVTMILNRSRFNKISISDKYKYLGTLAYEMHQKSHAALPEDDVRTWHDAYWRAIGVKVDFEKLAEDLIELSILQKIGDKVSFRYKYHYCFFVAYFLSENISDQAVRRVVRQMAGQLFHQETGDILLFLSHLSNDSMIPEEMLSTAANLIADAPEANLIVDVAKINRLDQTAPQFALPDGGADMRREQQLEHQDVQEDRSAHAANGASLSAMPSTSDEDARKALQLPAAFKTLQILGQFARNHAGSLPVEVKARVIESMFRLGKRLLGLFFSLLDIDLPQIANEMAFELKKEQPDIARDDLVAQIGRHVFGMSQLSAFIVTKHVSMSIAHDLLEPIVQEVAKEMGDLPSSFFDLAVSLERPGYIDIGRVELLKAKVEQNQFDMTLLRLLVLHHMYLFNVNYRIRQRVADLLNFRPPKAVFNQDQKRLKSKGVSRQDQRRQKKT